VSWFSPARPLCPPFLPQAVPSMSSFPAWPPQPHSTRSFSRLSPNRQFPASSPGSAASPTTIFRKTRSKPKGPPRFSMTFPPPFNFQIGPALPVRPDQAGCLVSRGSPLLRRVLFSVRSAGLVFVPAGTVDALFPCGDRPLSLAVSAQTGVRPFGLPHGRVGPSVVLIRTSDAFWQGICSPKGIRFPPTHLHRP